MKCFLVVNQLNDPFYIDYDTEFSQFIIQKCKEKELLEPDTEISELDANLVMQIFSPMVLSQWLLIDQIKEPCSTITCPNGFRFVFKHVDDLLFIAMNGDGSETEEFLHRKVQVFVRLMRFLFGPVSEEIGHSRLHSKKAKWAFLRSLMNTWSEMFKSEQTFLVEAVEKLNVNQMVSEKCMEILEKSVRLIQSVQDYPIQHAVLLVNSRLLALYSKRIAHELRAKDILSLMILSKTLYPNFDDDTDSKAPASKANHDDNSHSDGAEDEYHSAPTTPRSESRSRTPLMKQEEKSHKAPETMEENVAPQKEESNHEDPSEEVSESDEVNTRLSFDSNLHSPEKNVSLLDMYREKYPDSDTDQDGKNLSHHCRASPSSQVVYAEVHNSNGDESSDQGTDANKDKHSSRIQGDGQDSIRDSQEEEIIVVDGSDSDFDFRNVVVTNKDKEPILNKENRVDRQVLQGSDRQENVIGDQHYDKAVAGPTTLMPERFEHDVYSVASRSSSVLSDPIKKFPDLLPCDQDFSFEIPSKESPVPFQNPRSGYIKTDEIDHSKSYAESETSSKRNTGSSGDAKRNYSPQTIFLETSTCLHSPYHVQTVQVLEGVTLVLLSQAPRHAMADYLYQIMHNIQDLIQGRRSKLPRSRSLHVYEIVNSLLSKLHSALRKSKGKEGSLIQDIHSRWEKEEMKNKFLEYLEKDIHCLISPELESPMWEMYKKLRELFSLLFLHPLPENIHLKESLFHLRDCFRAELMDYKDYLNVKAERNITMTSYIEEFPGLVHFVFIDRRLHQMTAPSLSVTHDQEEKSDANAYIKKYIWQMYQHMMKKLMEGYTTVIMKDGDFYFSYFLWFEDSKRNPLPVQELFKPSNKLPYPGVLCGSFYKDIVKQCFPHALHSSVYCHEMFLMHLGTVHPQYIAAHCRKLAHKMWEMSGDAYSPLNLL